MVLDMIVDVLNVVLDLIYICDIQASRISARFPMKRQMQRRNNDARN